MVTIVHNTHLTAIPLFKLCIFLGTLLLDPSLLLLTYTFDATRMDDSPPRKRKRTSNYRAIMEQEKKPAYLSSWRKLHANSESFICRNFIIAAPPTFLLCTQPRMYRSPCACMYVRVACIFAVVRKLQSIGICNTAYTLLS